MATLLEHTMHVGRLDSQVAPGVGSVLLEEELEAYGVFDVLGERELHHERGERETGYCFKTFRLCLFFYCGLASFGNRAAKNGGRGDGVYQTPGLKQASKQASVKHESLVSTEAISKFFVVESSGDTPRVRVRASVFMFLEGVLPAVPGPLVGVVLGVGVRCLVLCHFLFHGLGFRLLWCLLFALIRQGFRKGPGLHA